MAKFVYNFSLDREVEKEIAPDPFVSNEGDIELLEWQHGLQSQGIAQRIHYKDLDLRPSAPLRIIFAPLDNIEDPRTGSLVEALYMKFDIPLDLAIHGIKTAAGYPIRNSFGMYEDGNCFTFWAHTMMKTLRLVKDDRGRPYISDSQPTQYRKEQDLFPQKDSTWLPSAFYLKWQRAGNGDDNPAQVVLLGFNVPPVTKRRLYKLLRQPEWEGTLGDPLNLFVVILETLFLHIRQMAGNLMNAYRHVEGDAIDQAQSKDKRTDFDFVGMARIANHINHLGTSINGTLSTAKRICEHHAELIRRNMMPETAPAVQQLLMHKEILIEGSAELIKSLDSRMRNTSSLAFNTVNQLDSRAMRSDSEAVKV